MTDSPVPVSVITAKDLSNASVTSLDEALQKLTPSFSSMTNGMGTTLSLNGLPDDYFIFWKMANACMEMTPMLESMLPKSNVLKY